MELSRLHGDEGAPVPNEATLRLSGLSVSLILAEGDFRPHFLIGAGLFRLQEDPGRSNPHGTTAAVQVGTGLNGPDRLRIRPFVEVLARSHLTDYGSGGDFRLMTTIPIMVGVRVPL